MTTSKTLLRKDRITMFLNEYYFGYPVWITILRIIGGPLLFLVGMYLYQQPSDRFGIAYGGFCIAFGIYYILKPALWVLFRLDSFKTTRLEISIAGNKLKLKDDISESEILLQSLHRILRRRNYYALAVTRYTKIYLPFHLLTEHQRTEIETVLDGKGSHPIK